MTPLAWRNGGRGETVRWITAETSLGTMLVAATEKGICRLSFEEGEEELRTRFPRAAIERGREAMRGLVEGAVAAVEAPGRTHDLPLDVRGTAFQKAVWRELARIPPGESLSYAALAARAGKPGAARAAGSACGANNIAVLIPCHRARRGDGSPGGFAYGLERKAALLEREGSYLAGTFLRHRTLRPTTIQEDRGVTGESIREGMQVLGSDGGMVGRVLGLHEDHIHVEPTAPVHGGDHVVPRKWVVRADDHVHLDREAALVRDTWGSGEGHSIAQAQPKAARKAPSATRQPERPNPKDKNWIVWLVGGLLLLLVIILGIRGFGYAGSDTRRDQPAVEAPDV